MSQNQHIEKSEIDLHELFAVLWAHKVFITLVTGLCLLFAGYYALNSEKKFSAIAIFQIEEINNPSNFNFSGELGALASLAGLASSGGGSSVSELLLERTTGREFIKTMMERASLDFDPYFNTYDPNYRDPFWILTLKKFIGWDKTEREKKAIVEQNVIKNYRKNVNFEATDGGAILISVTHLDPKLASNYANTFMDELRRLVEDESIAAQNLRLNYLSKTLADALQEMEETQENLKNYNFENSALAQENFISDSLRLDQIRMERRKVSEIADLLSTIESLVKSGNLDADSFDTLRSSQPLVDDIEFRRILGMSETISAWTWPEIETIEAISATLRDRMKRLDIDIKNIEENAKIYATSAEDLAKLMRDAKIAEATYTVLIEQVKSQSLAAGFQPDTFKVFEYATPPLTPSSPKIIVLVPLGAIIGFFLGAIFAVINSVRRGVYYTRTALISDANPKFSVNAKSIKRSSRRSLSEITKLIAKRRLVELDQLDLRLSDKKIVYVLNSGGRPSASNAARLLAAKSAQSGRSVVLCDTTGQSEKEIKNETHTNRQDQRVVDLGNNVNGLIGVDWTSFFNSINFKSTVKDLTNKFDQVVICSNTRSAQLGLIALVDFTPGLVLISGLRKTKKSDIQNIKTTHPIDFLLYD